MGTKRDREEFIARVATYSENSNVALDFARELLRLSATHGRLAEAQCNGDYPYHGPWNTKPAPDNSPYSKVVQCTACESEVIKSTRDAAGFCKACRIEQLLEEAVKGSPFKVETQGDPRGWTVKLITPNGREIGVPQ